MIPCPACGVECGAWSGLSSGRRRDSKTKNGSDNNLKISFFIFFLYLGEFYSVRGSSTSLRSVRYAIIRYPRSSHDLKNTWQGIPLLLVPGALLLCVIFYWSCVNDSYITLGLHDTLHCLRRSDKINCQWKHNAVAWLSFPLNPNKVLAVILRT